MESEELAELSRLSRGGDVAARDRIVEHHRGFAASVVRDVAGRKPGVLRRIGDLDDATQLGMIALIRAAETWDPGRGVRFMSYVAGLVENKLYGAARRRRETVRLEDEFDWVPDESRPEGDAAEVEDWVHGALSRLEPGDRDILVMRYGIGGADAPMSSEEIGARIGGVKSWVNKLIRRAEGRFADALGVRRIPVTRTSRRPGSEGPRVIELDGERMTVPEWGRRVGVNPLTIWARLNRGASDRDAVFAPVVPRNRRRQPA